MSKGIRQPMPVKGYCYDQNNIYICTWTNATGLFKSRPIARHSQRPAHSFLVLHRAMPPQKSKKAKALVSSVVPDVARRVLVEGKAARVTGQRRVVTLEDVNQGPSRRSALAAPRSVEHFTLSPLSGGHDGTSPGQEQLEPSQYPDLHSMANEPITFDDIPDDPEDIGVSSNSTSGKVMSGILLVALNSLVP
jgi:hypothetical protein